VTKVCLLEELYLSDLQIYIKLLQFFVPGHSNLNNSKINDELQVMTGNVKMFVENLRLNFVEKKLIQTVLILENKISCLLCKSPF